MARFFPVDWARLLLGRRSPANEKVEAGVASFRAIKLMIFRGPQRLR